MFFRIAVYAVQTEHLISALFKEFDCDLSELGVGEDILLLHDPLSTFLTQLIQLRLQQICGTAGDRLRILEA